MSIADAILRQIQQAGQPRTIKSTETVTGKEPIDIGGLGLLLYIMMEMQKKTPTGPMGGPVAGGIFPGSELMGLGAPAQAQGFGGMDPMQMIMSIMGGTPTMPGLGGL